jgi:eukaryotic-like serine/threonine-protein kinase
MERAPKSALDSAVNEAPTSPSMQRVFSGEASPIAVGDLIASRYRIEKELGAGGVGIVYLARNIGLDELVALKFLKPEVMTDAGIIGRFAREAKAVVSIKNEHVATVYDVGFHTDGRPFLVMEYLEGKDLATVLEFAVRLPVPQAVEYAMQACEALAVAHARGIVHRDIKPENIMITERSGTQVVKVLDFGISKAALEGQIFGENLPLVTTSNLMGTPMYMSPEQVRCQDDVDARCDIWSLGMMLYEMIAGETPFRGTTVPELCAAILEQTPQPLENHRRDIPAGLTKVLMTCLAKTPSNRYQSVAELAYELLPFAPKRARIHAERALSALQASGRLTEPFPAMSRSSLPPDAMKEEASPGLPQPSSRMAVTMNEAPPAVVPKNGRKIAIAVGAAAVLAVALGVGALSRSSKPDVAVVPTVSLMAPVAPVTTVAASPPPAISAVANVASAPASTGVSTKEPPQGRLPGQRWVPRPLESKKGNSVPTASAPPPVVTTAAAPAKPAKPSGPDLGY